MKKTSLSISKSYPCGCSMLLLLFVLVFVLNIESTLSFQITTSAITTNNRLRRTTTTSSLSSTSTTSNIITTQEELDEYAKQVGVTFSFSTLGPGYRAVARAAHDEEQILGYCEGFLRPGERI